MKIALRTAAIVVTVLTLGVAPGTGSAAGALAARGYERTIDLGADSVEVEVHYGGAAAGASALAGEASLMTALPGHGHLTLELPHVVGETASLGNAQLSASYEIAHETEILPKLGLVALVDLPTAPGAHVAHPGVRAAATKKLDAGPLESVRVESQLWTNGPDLAPSYRAAIETDLRLSAATTGSLGLVALRPSPTSGAPRENRAQLRLSQRIDKRTGVSLGLAAGFTEGAPSPSFRASFGVERHF